MSVTILRDEWIKALEEADMGVSDDPDAITVVEFAAMTGLKREAAKRRLEALVDAGKATRTFKWAMNGYGRRHRCQAYKLTRTGKKRKAA